MIGNLTVAVGLLDTGSCCASMGGWGWLGMMGGSVMMLGLIVLVAWAVRARSNDSNRDPSALEILAVRYANGDISEEEYDERRSVLGG